MPVGVTSVKYGAYHHQPSCPDAFFVAFNRKFNLVIYILLDKEFLLESKGESFFCLGCYQGFEWCEEMVQFLFGALREFFWLV